MKLRPKLTTYLLVIASVPLVLAMSVALWQSSSQTHALTIDIVQGYLDAGANNLSGYFSARKSEISAYARSPLLKSMDFQSIRPFLVDELGRHGDTYEKFILGTENGNFYNTAGGNPSLGGLRTFDDMDPTARPKTITRRDYWRMTVGDNEQNQERVYVSNPMISYTTGAKQIVVAASIHAEEGQTVGMIGGALPWSNFEEYILKIFDDVIRHRNLDSRFFLVSSNGIYWYHWDPEYVVHLEKDSQDQPVLNEIGEKVTSGRKVTEERIEELAEAGSRMVAGQRGYTLFTDPDSGEEFYLVYAPVDAAAYSVGLIVPKKQMMAPVISLQSMFAVIVGLGLLMVIAFSWMVSKKITRPIMTLRDMVKAISDGHNSADLVPIGDDEVAELTNSFNAMSNAITAREQSLRENEERFSLAMQGANDGLWDWNIDSNEVFFSPRYKSMLGYREDELDNHLETWKQLIHPKDLEKLSPHLDDFISGKHDKYEAEFRMCHKDGHWVDILSRAVAVRNESNRATRLVGTHVDISDRRRTETEIKELNEKLEERVKQRTIDLERAIRNQRESESRHKAILESVLDALITIDQHGIIKSVNPATETMFGYSIGEMVGEHVSLLIPECTQLKRESAMNKHADNPKTSILGSGGELIAHRRDHSTFPVELSVSEVSFIAENRFTALIKDISDRKNAENDLLRESLALTRLNEIAADPATLFEQKVQQLLELGLDTFDLSLGIVSHIDNDTYTIEHVIGPAEAPAPGTTFSFSETYCAHTYAANSAKAFDHAGHSEISEHPCYRNFKLESYIGAPIIVDGQRYGTLNFSSPEVHRRPFSNNELSLIQLLAQWIGNEMSRSRSERVLTQFKTTLDQTMDCVFMFEPASLKFFYVNQGAMEQVGYSESELMNMTPFNIKPEISEQEFRDMIDPLIQGKQPSLSFETVHQHKNGIKIPVEIFLQYINPPEESPRFVAIVRDVSERHEATRKLNATIDEMAHRTKEITSLSELADLLHSCHNVSEAYDVVTRFMPMLLPTLSGALYISDDSGTSLETVGVWGTEPPQETVFMPADCVAVRRGLAYLSKADESVLFCRHLPDPKPALSLCMPLAAQGETFGLLHIQADSDCDCGTEDQASIGESLRPDFSETIAKQVSMALASLRSREQLQNQSIRDPLTGLFNRRYMEESFERELHRAARKRSLAVSFMMIDIDHFKRINDTFGHDAGDMVLREFSYLLTKKSRKEDIACRFGGEEFVLCLPGASRETAEKRASDLRESVKRLSLRYEGDDVGPITISIGISIYPELGETPAELMKKADQALYQAKENGRDRIVFAGPTNNLGRVSRIKLRR
jgi:diguanylate cyclase (GGDEF)-like protein/PAS domain S-box-containing protein